MKAKCYQNYSKNRQFHVPHCESTLDKLNRKYLLPNTSTIEFNFPKEKKVMQHLFFFVKTTSYLFDYQCDYRNSVQFSNVT